MTGGRAARLALGAAGTLVASGAPAGPWTLGGTATLRGGYEANPYLTSPSRGGAGLAAVAIAAEAVRRAPRSDTALTAQADLAGYAGRYGRNTNLSAGVSRTQRLSAHLQAAGDVRYADTLSPGSNFGFDPARDDAANLDYLTVGTRSRRIDGSLNLDWQAGARDTIRLGGSASHARYGGRLDSSYRQTGATASWLHDLDARTKIGLQVNASEVRATAAGTARSIETMLLAVREIDPRWRFEGGVGAVRQTGAGARGGTTLSFSGSLCGTYPRLSLCLTARRQAAPSGIGGLRTDTQARIDAGYDLSARSRITLAAAVDDSRGGDRSLIARQLYADASAGYSRRLGRRLAVGATGRAQRREIGRVALLPPRTATGYALAGTATYDFGQKSHDRTDGL